MSNKNVVEKLKEVLANSYILALKTQNYHWNVTGPNFKSLHELFELQYDDLSEAVDSIAERIRALDAYAPGSFQAFKQLADIKEEIREGLTAAEILKQLIADQDLIITNIQKALEVAQKANDEATADMLINRIEVHGKNRWMLKSSC